MLDLEEHSSGLEVDKERHTAMNEEKFPNDVQEDKPSSPYIRITREEGRAIIERNKAFAEEFMQYLKDHNMLPKKCPARKVEK